jgi:hypothetical protein
MVIKMTNRIFGLGPAALLLLSVTLGSGNVYAQEAGAVAAGVEAVKLGSELYARLATIPRGTVVSIENNTNKALHWAGVDEYSGTVVDYANQIEPDKVGFVLAQRNRPGIRLHFAYTMSMTTGGKAKLIGTIQ